MCEKTVYFSSWECGVVKGRRCILFLQLHQTSQSLTPPCGLEGVDDISVNTTVAPVREASLTTSDIFELILASVKVWNRAKCRDILRMELWINL